MEVTMNSAFESIQKGLVEAIEFSEGHIKSATVHEFDAVDVKEECDDADVAST